MRPDGPRASGVSGARSCSTRAFDASIAALNSASAWRVAAFRGYADHLASAEYIAACEALMAVALRERTCVMCAEALWWQCHRRLIADDFVARGWTVLHLLAPGKTEPHALNADAVMVDGVLRYPAPQARLL